MKTRTAFLLYALVLIFITTFAIQSCNNSSQPDPAPPERPEAVIEIPYQMIVGENPGKEFKPMAAYPGLQIRIKEVSHINIEDLPKDKDIGYDELNSFAQPAPTKSTCSGSKSCEFKCGQQAYRVVNIPDACRCYSWEGGLDIVCNNGCNSYEILCRQY